MRTTLLFIVAMALGSHGVAAQTTVLTNGDALALNAAAIVGYDDDVTVGTANTPSTDPRLRTGGSFVMTNLDLSYVRQSRGINFASAAAASVRRYRAIDTFTADSYGGSVRMSANVAPRFRVGANASGSRSSHFTLNILPVFVEDVGSHIHAPSLDYSLTPGDLIRYQGGVQLNYNPTRRSTVYANYSAAQSNAVGRRLDLQTTIWGVGYSHGVTQHASVRVGFRRQQATDSGSRRTPVDSYDIGVNYSRPLSISRRTTMSFGGGSAVVGTELRRYGHVIGHATLNHRFSRTWDVVANYNRAAGFIEGFEDPVLTDSVVSTLVGRINRRVTTTVRAGYANGNIGVGTASSSRYTTSHAGVTVHIGLYRGLFAVTDYIFYRYQFDHLSGLPFGAPSYLNRHGIRSGILYNVPLT